MDPGLDEQAAFWNQWNSSFRTGDGDAFQARQAEIAIEVAKRCAKERGRLHILDVGCGTGWLGARLLPWGKVTGTDLSQSAIERGRALFPEVTLMCGDFPTLDLGGPFDLVVSADVIAHVADQQAFVDRVAQLTADGGVFVLMTQNGSVWRRSSYLMPQGKGQIRNWPALSLLKDLLSKSFAIEQVTSIVPGGDRGVLWPTGNWVTRKLKYVPVLGSVWTRALERAMVGRELVLVARKR